MTTLLETERMRLRRFTAADLEHLVELDSDPEVMRYLTGRTPTPRETVEREMLPRILRSYAAHAGFGYWAAIEKAGGAFLGWFAFRPPEGGGPENVEIGYRLRRAAWGRGLATEGARALIDRGFRDLGVERVFATTYQDNLASRRVMEKAGLRHVRSFRPTPEFLAEHGADPATAGEIWDGDEVEYAITRQEWERRQPPHP